MDDIFTCKHCWNFHSRGKAEQGTCRARLTPVKTNRNAICTYPKGFTIKHIVVTYNIVDKRGGKICGITDVNLANEMCNEGNEEYRKKLINYRKLKDEPRTRHHA